MLTITIPGVEFFDEELEEFVNTKDCTLELEHSLISLSKWESKWGRPFLSPEKRTDEQALDYIRFMTITRNVDEKVYAAIPDNVMKQVSDYIEAPMTATTFYEIKSPTGRPETVTAELIYYWMIALTIPFECQKWHLNRLMTLIRVCNVKNQPPQKMSRSEIASRNRSLNAARRKALGTTG